MDVLRKLLRKLDIDEKYLVITDKITGAGYIAKHDNVFCRWGHILEGIAVMEAYLDAELLYRSAQSELE